MTDIDLHLHTNYSDGIESPSEIVRRAKDQGLNIIAVTDHDGIEGVREAQSEGEKLGVRVISGVEFSTGFFFPSGSPAAEEHYMHILGYGIDLENDQLSRKMQEIIENRKARNKRLQQAFSEAGIFLTDEELRENAPSGYIGKVSFARAFAKRGLVPHPEDAFRSDKLMRNPLIRAIRKEKTSAQEAIRVIHQSGGKAFMAHPYQLSGASVPDDEEALRERLSLVLEELRSYGLDGLECYYPTHDRGMTEYLLAVADRLGLLVSIGSDDHGPNVRKIKKMNSFCVEADVDRLSWVRTLL